jgi:hypothetical protein
VKSDADAGAVHDEVDHARSKTMERAAHSFKKGAFVSSPP